MSMHFVVLLVGDPIWEQQNPKAKVILSYNHIQASRGCARQKRGEWQEEEGGREKGRGEGGLIFN